ncbi:hypothetical protein PO654_25605 [Phytobacter diazotrophicus]|uniref:hypothetical protein n=1 Tax=Phytobacter diazotrophicus TaxID=395631 RepID=UPI0011594C64|nr:hypothetical protein [Enterobacteriaceae bacterium]QIH66804.1 hypothetical protein CRX67_27885 [Enterobacteriaceae bacterium A-F18]VTP13855.1 hypothetical protein PUATCC27989T_01703 [Phytobacter ursingii]
MCASCSLQAEYFHTVKCMYQHLVLSHPVLWLRDSSRVRTGYVSRNFLSVRGRVLAVWKGPGLGWRLRQPGERAPDENPDPCREDFVELTCEADTFQAFMLIE